jgi:hypothetical protein
VLERSAFEEQTNCQVSAQRNGEISRRHAIGPFLNLPHNAGPSSQCQQLGAQVVLIFGIGDAELGQRIRDRAECIPIAVQSSATRRGSARAQEPHCPDNDVR